jgi:hypothetical protein
MSKPFTLDKDLKRENILDAARLYRSLPCAICQKVTEWVYCESITSSKRMVYCCTQCETEQAQKTPAKAVGRPRSRKGKGNEEKPLAQQDAA